jgi:NAD(P)-dependent dehydrogenase (short-subunit alcohol dehydrogenase family)
VRRKVGRVPVSLSRSHALFRKLLADVPHVFLGHETIGEQSGNGRSGDSGSPRNAYCRCMAFSFESTTDDVLDGVDLTGRRVVVTGAASGLGEESTRALAAHGASVLMLARDPQKNADAAGRIRATVPDADLSLDTVDLADLASVRAFAARYNDSGDPIDVLMNNAGVMACPFGHTADGFEMQFGTNHLGHFELTRLLTPAVQAGTAPRIVILSSAAHGIADVDLDDPGFEQSEYDAWISYGRSKSANALHALALAERVDGVLSFSVHPGGIMTNLGRHLNDDLMQQMLDRAKDRAAAVGEEGGMQFKSIPQGAATQCWAATSEDLAGHNGAYLADCGLGVEGANIGRNGFAPYIADTVTAAKLWDLSERLVDAV